MFGKKNKWSYITRFRPIQKSRGVMTNFTVRKSYLCHDIMPFSSRHREWLKEDEFKSRSGVLQISQFSNNGTKADRHTLKIEWQWRSACN